jgi:hypothetical protein
MITGSINMAALKYVIMEKKGKDGNPVKGMFIPINVNHLKEHENGGIYLNLVAFDMKEPKDWGTHTIKQSFTKIEREAMGEEAYSKLPILGNLKAGGSAPAAADNNAAPDQVHDADGDGDLPF